MKLIRKILNYFAIIKVPKPMVVKYRVDGYIYQAQVMDYSEDYYIITTGTHAGNFLHKLDVIGKKS